MGIKSDYYIDEVTYKTAMHYVIKYHYLHRKASCSFSYALIEKQSNRIVGVITYGTPSSSTLRKGVCGIEEKDNVIELTRLWVEDSTPKNAESFLIGNTIKLLNKEIVVTYAEIEQGHVGTVYQATNFLYTGMSAKHGDWKVEGLNVHNQTLTDKYTIQELKDLYGDKMVYVQRPRKHRYVYFNCNKRRKKELMKALRYKTSEYPKKIL